MPDAKEQITTTIFAVILVLLFFGVLFIVMLSYINYRRRQTAQEKKAMQDQFDQQLMQTRLEIQEQTFRYLSEEIHDHVGQLLSLAKIQLSSFKEEGPIDFPMLKDAGDNVARALQDLRSLAKGLHAGHIRHFSIREAVDEEVQRVRKAGGLTVSVTSEGAEKKIKDDKQLILFRIIQECLQNCLKHAAATNINIGFTWYAEQLRVRVRDDGQGFDAERALAAANGLGLENIRNRARLTGGSSAIQSRPGEGTTVTVQIPYE
ncbi:MAG TPA: sensor histidine kinase [Puia sp.]|nr:sensor histidine kinase [Puia sp.]